MKVSPRVFTPADWLKAKPYKQLSAYDTFYVQQCRELYALLLDYGDFFTEANLEREDLIALARMLGSYFEDFTNEIGIWNAFVRHNQTLYGYPLPFYDLTDYDPDYLNAADFAFLIWKFVTNANPTRTWAPDHPYIMEMAEEAYDLLEEQIEEAPARDYYEKYFTIRATDNFFLVKEKLNWFGLQSYLMGTELGPKLVESIEESALQLGPENITKMIYLLAEPFTFSTRSSFSALNAAEWFAEVARCPEAVKTAIRDTQTAHMGHYVVVDDSDKTYYTFQHVQTDRPYRVRRDSLENGKPLKDTKKMLFLMNLRQWNGDWWLSGTLSGWEAKEEYIQQERNKPVQSPWLYDDEKLALLRESETEQEQTFLEFYGSRLVTFRNETEYQDAQARFMEFSNKRNRKHDFIAPEGHDERISERLEAVRKGGSGLSPELRRAKDISLFYDSGAGALIIPNAKADAIDILTNDNPTDLQKRHLFELMAIYMNPAVARYLLHTYGTRYFRYPISLSRVDAVRDAEFLWRFHSPDEFDAVYPKISLL